MGAAEELTVEQTPDQGPTVLELAPEPVEVRRNPVVSGALGVVSAGVAIAYLARAAQSGSVWDWALAVGLGVLATAWLIALVDARTPLLVADEHGVRIRLGRAWHGLVWGAVHHVEHERRRSPWSDPRLVVVPHNEERFESELDASARRHVRLSRRLHGAGLAVPLGVTTTLRGAGDDLGQALARLAPDASRVVEIEPTHESSTDDVEPTAVLEVPSAPESDTKSTQAAESVQSGHEDHGHEKRADQQDTQEEQAGQSAEGRAPWYAPARARLAHWLVRLEEAAGTREADADLATDDLHEALDEDPDATREWHVGGLSGDEGAHEPREQGAPSPVRALTSARRHEITIDLPEDDIDASPLVGRSLRSPGHVDLVEETQAWGDRVRPIARPGDAVEPLVLDDFEVAPAQDPVIGPELAAARTRLGLSVDALAERTRIRSHVISSIEVDDFEPCGGDFYARGHLRTLARVLGVDGEQLLATYDQRYAHAPINPRRVFEAELATGVNGSIRSTRGGPNWSVLVAVVMAVVLCWSIVRLVMDSPADLRPATPVLNGSGGPNGSAAAPADPVSVDVVAATGGAHVVVRDGAGEIVYKGSLAAGESHSLKASPPVRVQSSDGSVTVALAGGEASAVGEPGVSGQATFVVR